jgi:hypothetical protein
MTREWWADGPEDDREEMAFEAARDEVMDDADALAEIATKVRAEFDSDITEICSGAWSVEGAKIIAARMCAAADHEINQRARNVMDGWAESRALSCVED